MGLYLRHPASLLHDTGPHPENATRIEAIEAAMEEVGWPGIERVEPPPADRAWLERVHSPEHIAGIERFCARGGGMIDMDTVAVEASWEAALRASGGAATAAERLLAGEDRWAFCGLRPPGHHATSIRAMGFCLLNNAAVAAAHAIAACGAERVLIVDWDVHHGNGTAEIFDRDRDVLYVSIHQSPLYPGTGHPDEVGEGEGVGFTINLPVPPGTGGERFLALVQRVAVPAARAHRPGLVIISAGYDAHASDPLAGCTLRERDYAAMAATLRDLAAELDAPVLVCLEGGYALEALASSVRATLLALGGSGQPPDADPALAREEVARVERHWPAVGGRAAG